MAVIKIILIVLSCLFVLLAAAALLFGHFLVAFSLKRDGRLVRKYWNTSATDITTLKPGTPKFIIETNYRAAMEKMKAWRSAAKEESLTITSYDGLKLVGHIFRAPDESKNWVVLVHGYRDTPGNILTYALPYIEKGYNIFFMDQRAHGDSEGRYIGMGYPEHFDLLDWLDALCGRYPGASIVLHGHSMGSATILMASGEKRFPSNVKCIIADCGFSSIWEEFSSNLKQMFGLPPFPLLYASNLISRLETKLDFRKGSTTAFVARSRTPIFFIHGDSDTFVPTSMVYKLYDAAVCEKQLYVAIGAAHVDSQYIDPDNYYSQVFAFIDRYLRKD